MSKAIRASVLVLLLTCPAQAGWIQNESPASQPADSTQEQTSDETLNGEMSTPPSVSDSLTQITLELLASVLP